MFAPTPENPQLTIQPRNFAAVEPRSWQTLVDTARAADAAGVDRIVVSDHVLFGSDLASYSDPSKGGTAGGKQPTGPDGHWLEPLTTLSFLAGQTKRVRLGTAILLAALRRPAVLAKTCATLDVLSGGRLDLGVGVGWQQAEYDAAGLEFARRGRLLDQTLEVCQSLWTQTPASFRGEDLAFNDVHAMPKPVQPGGVPVWVSGTVNPRAMKRLATFGTGWIPWGPAVQDPVAGIAAMRSAVAEQGRDPSTVQVTSYLKTVAGADGPDLEATMRQAAPLQAAGVTDFKLALAIPEGVEAATDFLSTAVAAFRGARA